MRAPTFGSAAGSGHGAERGDVSGGRAAAFVPSIRRSLSVGRFGR